MSARLEVIAKPGSRAPGITLNENVVVVAVRERAVDGSANAAVVRAVAERLGVPPSAVSIVRGTAGRRKLLVIETLDDATVARRLRQF